MDVKKLPADLTPLNLHAYLSNAFSVCGCAETETVRSALLKLLEWHAAGQTGRPMYDTLYSGEAGVFYLMAGLLDGLHLAEHGTAIRHPWLTEDGKRLLEALQRHSAEEIEAASGEAYDGLWYG